MTGITNFFGNGKIAFGKISIQQTPLFDLEETFEYSESWPGTFSEPNYTWSPAILASPEVVETFEYSESWPGTFSEPNYTWSPAILASPNISDGFETAEGW